MNLKNMLKHMCKNDLSNSDIKAICKSRGFPVKEVTSRDIFENFFISSIGIKEALNSLTYEEVVFLHLLNKINKKVDIEYFDRLYGSAKSAGKYNYLTFTQQYKETFKKVRDNLVRKGVLIITEQEVNPYNKTSKMERLRFYFPPEFAEFLPPAVKASKFEGAGELKKEVLRDKLLEIIGGKQKPSPLSNKGSFALTLKDGNLSIGNETFRAARLLKWQQACWHALIEANVKTESGNLKPIEVIFYALSQLNEHEWLPADNLVVMLKIFTGVAADYPYEQMCETGWEWGCLVKLVPDGKAYYRLPDDPLENTTSTAHGNYLQVQPGGKVILNLARIPYTVLEVLASISTFDIYEFKLQASPNLTKIGNALETVINNNAVAWLKENSPEFLTAIETAQKRWGKQIIHENLMIARVKDLSLKVQLEKSFADPKNLVPLPNDYIAFPCEQLPEIKKIVDKSGHVIKKAGAK